MKKINKKPSTTFCNVITLRLGCFDRVERVFFSLFSFAAFGAGKAAGGGILLDDSSSDNSIGGHVSIGTISNESLS